MSQPIGSELGTPSAAPVARPRPRLHPSVLAVVAFGGALGAGARYELVQAIPPESGSVPWTTLVINLAGSFVLGVLLTFVLERWPPTRYVRPFLGIGFLGAFTTFSTFTVELDVLAKDGHVGVAVLYVAVSLVGGIAAAYAGIVGGRAWPAMRRRVR